MGLTVIFSYLTLILIHCIALPCHPALFQFSCPPPFILPSSSHPTLLHSSCPLPFILPSSIQPALLHLSQSPLFILPSSSPSTLLQSPCPLPVILPSSIHPLLLLIPFISTNSSLICFLDQYIQLPYTVPPSASLQTPFSISIIPFLLSCHTHRNTHACSYI